MNNEIRLVLWFLLSIVIATVLVATPSVLMDYYGSCRKAEVYNKQNGTSYTCGDFFWAGEQINQQTQTIRLQGEK